MAGEFVETVYGLISRDFAKSPLGGLCVQERGVQTGPFGSQLHASDYVEQGTPIITVEHLGENRIIHANLPCVTDEDKERLSRYDLQTGDIVLSRVGSVDRRAIVRSDENGWLFSGRCLRVRPDREKIDPGYLSWFFGLAGFREYVRQIAVGATMPSLNTTILSEVPIYYPRSLKEQQAISCILEALDNKIELNRRMNWTLEKMVAAIFKSWFINFDLVRAKAEGRDSGLPKEIADLFPDSFEDSDIGPIPKGWTLGALGDIAGNPRRSVKPDEVPPTTPYIGLEHMPRRCIALDAWGRAEEVASRKSRFKAEEILFGKLRPYFHKVGIAPVDGVCSTDILVIVPKSDEWHSYVLSLVSSKAFVDYTDAHSAGTKMPRTNWKDMSRYPLALPPETLAKTFQDHVAGLHQRIGVSVLQNCCLAGLRDTLLPKLFSGEIEVPDIGKPVTKPSSGLRTETVIYTIGHSNHPIEKFVSLLRQHSITAVADVRSTPYSRFNPQFNREALAASLKKEGISYVFLGEELGARPEDPSCYDNGQADFARMAERAEFGRGLDRIIKGNEKYRIALMCAEKEPLDCHRTILVCRNLKAHHAVTIKHILADGSLEDHRGTEARLLKIAGYEQNLFDQETIDSGILEQAYTKREDEIAYKPQHKEARHE